MPNTDGKCSSRLRITPSSSSSTSSSRYHPHLASTAARTLLLACIPATTTAALSFLLGTCYGCQSIASSATAVLPSRSLCRANGRICFVNGPTGFLPHRHCDVSGSRGVKRRLDGFLGDLVVSGGPTHSSTRRMTMGSTRFKRGASRVGGKPGKPRGVGKKVRRLLEPASEAEVRERLIFAHVVHGYKDCNL